MAVSSGFFNSVNHDRLYDAEQVSSLFDGIILDGVYQNFGEGFRVVANSEVNDSVIVKTGRAWFDHTWTYNDSDLVIQLDPPNSMLQRVDAIVIDVNREQGTRKNSVICVKGSLGESTPPTLVNTTLHRQYPLAYVNMKAGSSSIISQANITNKIGSDECPVVTGVLDSLNLDMYYKQLEAEFNTWWDGIKDTLDEATATKLQNQINEIKTSLDSVESSYFDSDNTKKIINASLSYRGLNAFDKDISHDTVAVGFLPDDTAAIVCRSKVVFVNLEDMTVSSTASFAIKGSNNALVLHADFSSFPCKVIFFNLSHKEDSSSRYTSHTAHVATVTITSEHAVSVNYAETNITESVISSNVNYEQTLFPAYYKDGSCVLYNFSRGKSYTSTFVYYGIKISKDGAIAHNHTASKSVDDVYDVDYSAPFYLFMTTAEDFIYGFSKTSMSSSSYCMFFDPVTLDYVKRLKPTSDGFASTYPKNFLDINRPDSHTEYVYDADSCKFLKFSSGTYAYDVYDYAPIFPLATNCEPQSLERLGFYAVGDDDLRVLLDMRELYTSSASDYIGFGIYASIPDQKKYGIAKTILYNYSMSTVDRYTDYYTSSSPDGNTLDWGPPSSIYARSKVSNDRKKIYFTKIPQGTMIKQIPDDYSITESGGYNKYSYANPFGGAIDSFNIPFYAGYIFTLTLED